MSLDSIYSMLATPIRLVSTNKRNVKQVDVCSAINPDSHEAPQSQLPPLLNKKAHIDQSIDKVDAIDANDITDDDAPLPKQGKSLIKHIDVEV
ncbi:hypothetical protein [Shewanella aestuarii]|uniref:Uncharacterized protein n=1 Tax=Shewanella aestuarii TaxID=1028752 RepID=A0A6G9QMZ4_9GAMM|nr:hypothetical protein [Shewanella aestuarii]QIR15852.1 hypothetical protein HBH39_16315 [Shewanella aestuarii]